MSEESNSCPFRPDSDKVTLKVNTGSKILVLDDSDMMEKYKADVIFVDFI